MGSAVADSQVGLVEVNVQAAAERQSSPHLAWGQRDCLPWLEMVPEGEEQGRICELILSFRVPGGALGPQFAGP